MSAVNPSSSASAATPAEKLKARHAASGADHAHNPTVEEVVDQEDLDHPPPGAEPDATDAAESSAAAAGRDRRPKPEPLNLNSEEAFPSLGGPKPVVPIQSGWSKKPIVANGSSAAPLNGAAAVKGKGKAPAVQPAAQARRPLPPAGGTVVLPGRSIERISFAPNQLTPRQSLKRPIPEVLRDINRRSKARVEMRNGNNGLIIFEGTGPQADVRQALKEIAGLVGSKQSIKIPVPLAVRPHLIGRQGQTIQSIIRRTGAKIQVPKQDDAAVDDDEDATIDITIEGDPVAAEMARQEIQKIVNERTSNVTTHLKDIPAEFYTFLSSPQDQVLQELMSRPDLNINIPQYHAWQNAPPPGPAGRGQVPWAAQPKLPIKITGDREAVMKARERIERQTEALKRLLTSYQLPIERGRHQFIVGKDGDALRNLMAETGCSVIVPPSHEDSETLHIIGPQDKLDSAVNKIMDMATSMSVTNVDVARQHARAPQAHAHNIGRYLRERQAIEALEQQYGTNFVLPTSRDGAANWEIYSQDGKAGMRARTDALNLIAAHPVSRFHSMQVNPFFHSHLQSRKHQIRHDHGVHMLFPLDDAESHELILVFEQCGPPSEYTVPRQAPAPADIQEHQRGIRQAVAYLQSIVGDGNDVVTHRFEAPQKYHEKIQRFVDREHRAIDPHQIPAQLLFNRLAAGGQAPGFRVRGRMNDVNSLNAKLAAFLEQEKKDELERGYTTHLEYPHKYASFLIGKRGDNINRLQEEFDVELNYQEGKVELKGPKAKCDACKGHIASMVKKLEDETTHSIKVAPQYHGSLKGPKGTQVVRLQDRYSVRINFPRAASSPADDADAGTEGSFRNHHQQAPDVVTIKGPKKGADEAKDEILNLLQYLIDHSHAAVVSVAAKQIPSLIGSGGRELENLREQSGGCNIDIPKRDAIDANGRVEVKLRGTKQQVEAAKKILAERAKVFDNTVTKLLPVDPALYRTIIGPNGSNIQRIVAEAGGPDDQRAINRMVQFPKQGSDDRNIHISGPGSTVEKITKAIMALADGRKDFVTESVPVPHDKHRVLVGAGGSVRRKIETDFSVELQVPRAASDKGGAAEPATPAAVTLTGNPDNIAKARAHIEALLKEQSTATVQVPRHLHHLVADEGAIFRKLRNELGVTVDHAGVRPPQRPAAAAAPKRARPGKAAAGAMPLITDGPEAAADSHAWELVTSEPAAEAESGDGAKTIPWALRGGEDRVARARELIERAVERAGRPTATGYLVLPDARLYRYVIGPSGATVNGIRAKTGTTITVPRQGGGGGEAGGEAIEIRGEGAGVEEARDLILEAVRAAKERAGGRGRGA